MSGMMVATTRGMNRRTFVALPIIALFSACAPLEMGPQLLCRECAPAMEAGQALEVVVWVGGSDCEYDDRAVVSCGQERFEAEVTCDGAPCQVEVWRDYPLLRDEPELVEGGFMGEDRTLVRIVPEGEGTLGAEVRVRSLVSAEEEVFEVGPTRIGAPDALELSCPRECRAQQDASGDFLVRLELRATLDGQRLALDPAQLEVSGGANPLWSGDSDGYELALRFPEPGTYDVQVRHPAGPVAEYTLTID